MLYVVLINYDLDLSIKYALSLYLTCCIALYGFGHPCTHPTHKLHAIQVQTKTVTHFRHALIPHIGCGHVHIKVKLDMVAN